MSPRKIVLIVISGLFVTIAKPVVKDAERQQRVLLHGDLYVTSVKDALAETQAMVASLNATVISQNNRISQLETALQTETNAKLVPPVFIKKNVPIASAQNLGQRPVNVTLPVIGPKCGQIYRGKFKM